MGRSYLEVHINDGISPILKSPLLYRYLNMEELSFAKLLSYHILNLV